LAQLRNFGEWGGLNPPNPPSVRHCCMELVYSTLMILPQASDGRANNEGLIGSYVEGSGRGLILGSLLSQNLS
jgi:hypothetical protein